MFGGRIPGGGGGPIMGFGGGGEKGLPGGGGGGPIMGFGGGGEKGLPGGGGGGPIMGFGGGGGTGRGRSPMILSQTSGKGRRRRSHSRLFISFFKKTSPLHSTPALAKM